MNNFRVLLFLSILFSVFANNSAYSADTIPKDYYSQPDTLISVIKARGGKAVVLELIKNWNVWDSICDKVATGDQAWLKAAVALQPGADAGASEMPDLALGEALENNPEDVFKITAKAFEISIICGAPDVDNARYNSYELSMKAINLRIKKVGAITDRSLFNISKECMQYLEASKKGVAQFYEVEKK